MQAEHLRIASIFQFVIVLKMKAKGVFYSCCYIPNLSLAAPNTEVATESPETLLKALHCRCFLANVFLQECLWRTAYEYSIQKLKVKDKTLRKTFKLNYKTSIILQHKY